MCEEKDWDNGHEDRCLVVEPTHFIDWAPTASMWNRSHGANLIDFAIAVVLEAAYLETPFDLNQRLSHQDWCSMWKKYTCAIFLTVSPSTDEESREVFHLVKYMAAEPAAIEKVLTGYQRAQYAGLLEGRNWPVSLVYFGSDHRRNIENPPTCRYALSSARSIEVGDIQVPGFYMQQLDALKAAIEEAYGRGCEFRLANQNIVYYPQ